MVDRFPVRRSVAVGAWAPAEPPQRPVLIVNERSGGGKAARADVAEHARRRGIETAVLGPDQSLTVLVEEALAAGADALGMAGGDGSLAVVAAAALARDLPFVCIPAGTRNHFARDLGVDLRDIVGALDAFSDGAERRIDVATVGGRMFLNNVSLGVYGDALAHPRYRDAKVRTLLKTVVAGIGGDAGAQAPVFRVVDDVGREHAQPTLLLVSNNPYSLDPPLVIGTRATLAGGRLGIRVVDRPGATGDPHRAWTAAHLEVEAAGPVRAGVDGEAVTLIPPLHCAIRPAALRVRICARHPGVPPSLVPPRPAFVRPASSPRGRRSGSPS